MEGHSNSSKHPDLPPNYVTLLQLQERWTKERKQKHEQKGQQPPQPLPKQNQDRIRNLSQPIRATPHSQFQGNQTPTREAGAVTALTVSVVGQSEDNENAGKESKMRSWRKTTKGKKRTTSDKQKAKERSGVKEAQEDDVGECEAGVWVVKTEKVDADAKKDERGKEVVVDYRPKISDNATRKSDWIERKMVNAVDESDRNVKIEGKMLNAAKKGNRTAKVQNKMANATEESDRTAKIEGKMMNAVKKSNRTMKIRSKMLNAAEESDRRVNIEGKMVNAEEEIDGKTDGSDRTSHIEGKMVNAGEDSDEKMETQSMTVNAVEGSDRTLHIEGKMASAGKESDVKVEIERKFGVEEDNEWAKKQSRVIRPGDGGNGGYGDGFNRSYGRFRGGYRYCDGNAWHRGGSGRKAHRGEQTGTKNGMVWVRKKEVATGGSLEPTQMIS